MDVNEWAEHALWEMLARCIRNAFGAQIGALELEAALALGRGE